MLVILTPWLVCAWIYPLDGILLILYLKVQLSIDVLLLIFNSIIEIISFLHQVMSGEEEKMFLFLHPFYVISNLVSCLFYPTLNLYFIEILKIKYLIWTVKTQLLKTWLLGWKKTLPSIRVIIVLFLYLGLFLINAWSLIC